MRADIVPGGTFPDYELTDHAKLRRSLSELQGIDPMVLILSRGHFCPKDHQQHLALAAASEAVLAAGGTITHHHAVGRDHRPYYDRQRPDPFAHALRAAKAALDPRGILNPGVLFDPA